MKGSTLATCPAAKPSSWHCLSSKGKMITTSSSSACLLHLVRCAEDHPGLSRPHVVLVMSPLRQAGVGLTAQCCDDASCGLPLKGRSWHTTRCHAFAVSSACTLPLIHRKHGMQFVHQRPLLQLSPEQTWVLGQLSWTIITQLSPFASWCALRLGRTTKAQPKCV